MKNLDEAEILLNRIQEMAGLLTLISGAESENDFFQKLLEIAIKSIPEAGAGSIWKIEGALFKSIAGYGYNQDLIQKLEMAYEDSSVYNFRNSGDIVEVSNILDSIPTADETFRFTLNKLHNGETTPMSTLAAPLKVKGTIAGYIYIDKFKTEPFSDLSKNILKIFKDIASTFLTLKYLRDSEKEANELNSVYLSFITHELKTPLTSMLGFSETILGNRQMNIDEARGYVRKIYASSKHMNSLIDDISTFNKLNRETTLKIDKVNLKQMLYDSISIVEPMLSTEVELDIKIEQDTPESIDTDPTKLRQVLVNIIGNAIKYTEDGYVKVHVTCDNTTKELIFTVEDTGPGMPDDKLEDIFKPFVRLSKNKPGSGLGLAIVKKNVLLLKGRINVESELYKGTIITVKFPYSLKVDDIIDTTSE